MTPHDACPVVASAMVVVFAQASCAAFLAILFLQSGLDKVFDWAGNLDWLTGHFAKSPVAGLVRPMLAAVTVTELAAGALSGLGTIQILLTGSRSLAIGGAGLAVVALLQLFFGQRIAKDYAGAAVLVPYFILTQLALLLLALPA